MSTCLIDSAHKLNSKLFAQLCIFILWCVCNIVCVVYIIIYCDGRKNGFHFTA